MRPNEGIDMLSPSEDSDVAIESLLVRKQRQNIFNAILNRSLLSLGVRGDWRFCRNTANGASIYTNGIDVVCQGLCEKTDVTCNDYYRPYFYNYFNN